MPVPALHIATAGQAAGRLQFRGQNRTACYEGSLRPLRSAEVDLQVEHSAAGRYAIYKISSHSGFSFRRSWTHIRSDKTDVTVFAFVRRGLLVVSHADIRHVTGPHECTITRTARPICMAYAPDKAGLAESLHVAVPSHELYSIISDGLEAGRPFPTSKGELFVVERIFTLLFEEDGQIDPAIAEQLVHTLLLGLGRSIARSGGNPPAPQSIAEKRISDIIACIDRNFANPDLDARSLAQMCNISLRYLCHILKKNQLCFSTLIWERRMERAEKWLQDPAMQHHLVREIGYLAGFKSSAHFSRMFKNRFGRTPGTYRDQHITPSGAKPPLRAEKEPPP